MFAKLFEKFCKHLAGIVSANVRVYSVSVGLAGRTAGRRWSISQSRPHISAYPPPRSSHPTPPAGCWPTRAQTALVNAARRSPHLAVPAHPARVPPVTQSRQGLAVFAVLCCAVLCCAVLCCGQLCMGIPGASSARIRNTARCRQKARAGGWARFRMQD